MPNIKQKKKSKKRNKAIQGKLNPDELQKVYFAQTFGCVRKVWNLILEYEKKHYEETGEFLLLTPAHFKKMPEYAYLKDVDSLALCNAQLNLRQAFKNFFEREEVGFPHWKKKYRSKNSYTTNKLSNSNNIIVTKTAVRLPKIGWVKAKFHRLPPDGWTLKSVTVSQDKVGDYWISVLYEYEVEVQPIEEINSYCGLDYKSSGLCEDDTGKVYGNHKYYREAEKRLAKEQRRLSRKQGPSYEDGIAPSKNYLKQKKKVAKAYRKVARQRKDNLHKLSTEIANQYDLVCVETLDMQAIGNKGFHLGKATYDNGYGMFLRMLEYKLEDRGKYFVKVGKWYASSQICSNCGRKHKMPLDVRRYQCECGLDIDRDLNAAINIKREGLRVLLEENPNIACNGRAGTAQTNTLVEIGNAGNQLDSKCSFDSSAQSLKQEARLFISE